MMRLSSALLSTRQKKFGLTTVSVANAKSMDSLTSPTALATLDLIAPISDDFAFLLSNSSFAQNWCQTYWREFTDLIDKIVAGLENFDRLRLGPLLRSVQSLIPIYQTVFTAFIGDAKSERFQQTRIRALEFALVFELTIVLPDPLPIDALLDPPAPL
jgi:hypothetical protein